MSWGQTALNWLQRGLNSTFGLPYQYLTRGWYAMKDEDTDLFSAEGILAPEMTFGLGMFMGDQKNAKYASDIALDLYDKRLSGWEAFALDVALDPATYMTYSASGWFKGIGAAGRKLNRVATKNKPVRDLMTKFKGKSYDEFIEALETLPTQGAKTNRLIQKIIRMNRGGKTTRQAQKLRAKRMGAAGKKVPKDAKVALKDVIRQAEIEELALQFPFLAASRTVIGSGPLGKFLDNITLRRLNKQKGWFSNFGTATLAPAKLVNDYIASPVLRHTLIPAMDKVSGGMASWSGAYLSGLVKKGTDPFIKGTLLTTSKAYQNFEKTGGRLFQGDFTFQRAAKAAGELHPEARGHTTVLFAAGKEEGRAKRLADLLEVDKRTILEEFSKGKTVEDILEESFSFAGLSSAKKLKMQAKAEGISVAQLKEKMLKLFVSKKALNEKGPLNWGSLNIFDAYLTAKKSGIKPAELRRIIQKNNGDVQKAFEEIQAALNPAMDANSDIYKAYQKGQLALEAKSPLPKKYENASGSVKSAWLAGKSLRDQLTNKLNPMGGASVSQRINEIEFEGQRAMDSVERGVFQDTREIHLAMKKLVVEIGEAENKSDVVTFNDLDKILGLHQQASPQVEEFLAIVHRLDGATGKAVIAEIANLEELVARIEHAAELAKIASPEFKEASKHIKEIVAELRTSILDLKSSRSKIKFADDLVTRLESAGDHIRATNADALRETLGLVKDSEGHHLLEGLLSQDAKAARYASHIGADDQAAYFARLRENVGFQDVVSRLIDNVGKTLGTDNKVIQNLKRRLDNRNMTIQEINELLIEARGVGISVDLFEETAKYLRIEKTLDPKALEAAQSVLDRKILGGKPYLWDLLEASKKAVDPDKKALIEKAIRDATAPLNESWLSVYAHRAALAKRQLIAEDYLEGIFQEGNKHLDSRLTLMSGVVNKVHKVGDDTVIELQIGSGDMRMLNVSEMERAQYGVRNMGNVKKGDTIGQAAVRHQVRGSFPKGSQSMASIRKGDSIILGDTGLTSRLLDNTIPASEEMNALWKGFDRANALYKTTQTVLNPAFYIRNTLSNFFQTRAAGGSILNFAKAQIVAARMLKNLPENTAHENAGWFGLKGRARAVEQVRAKAWTKHTDELLEGELVPLIDKGDRPIGDEELLAFFAKRGLFNDLKATEELRVGTASISPAEFVEKLKNGDASWMEAVRDSGAAIEIHNRLSAAMTLVMDGKSPGLAVKKALDVHGDYAKLSKVERDWGRRAGAFYTFSRRVLPAMARSIDKDPRLVSTINKLSHNMDWIGVDQYGTLKIEYEGLEMNLSAIALPIEAAAIIAGSIDSLNSLAGLTEDVTPLGLGQPRDITRLAGGGAAGLLFSLLGLDPHREAGLRSGAEYTIQAQSFMRAAWKYAKAVHDDLPLDENLWAAAFLPVKIRKDPSYRRYQRIKIGDALISEINFQIEQTNNLDKIRRLKQVQVQITRTRDSLLKDLR